MQPHLRWLQSQTLYDHGEIVSSCTSRMVYVDSVGQINMAESPVFSFQTASRAWGRLSSVVALHTLHSVTPSFSKMILESVYCGKVPFPQSLSILSLGSGFFMWRYHNELPNVTILGYELW